MRSAPTLNSWMMPFSSVAMIEKLALVRMAVCSAPVFSKASWRLTSVMRAALPASSGMVATLPRSGMASLRDWRAVVAARVPCPGRPGTRVKIDSDARSSCALRPASVRQRT